MHESREDRYKLFGEVALERGFVTAVELYEALTIQAKDHVDGRERLLGQVLIEMGFMTAEQVSEVLDILFPSTPSDPLPPIDAENLDVEPESETELET